MAKKKNAVISHHGKRIALRSPLAIDSSELILDSENDGLVLNMIISNTSSEDSPARVESAGLVIRCLDSEGNLIVSNGREIISKTLKFPEEGLLPGASVGIKTQIDLAPDMVSDVDVYIGCIRTVDLMVVDFVRGDFFDEPSDPIPLSDGMSSSEIYETCETIGDFAAYYPDELSSLVWRCTCGQISDSDVCPMCATERKHLFDYFSKFKRPVVVTSSAERARKRTRLFIALFSGIFFAATIALIIVLFFFLPEHNKQGPTVSDPPKNDITEEIPEETIEEKEARMNDLLSEKEFAAALEIAQSHESLSKHVTAISESAVTYYLEKKEYDIAYGFSATCSDKESTEKEVLSEGFDYFLEKNMLEKAMSYAKLLNDREKINTIHIININEMVENKSFSDAVKLAIDCELDVKKEEVISCAVAYYNSLKDYGKSLEFALLSNVEGTISDLALEASYYYLGENDIENTLKFSKYAENDDLMYDIAEGLSDPHLRQNLGTFFRYLSFEKKQSLYASKVSLDKQIGVISSDGTVYYGLGKTYKPEGDLKAVSVSSSAHHTVILLSDGSVVAFGDDSFGQCGVSLWKDVVAIDTGEYHTVALLSDGSVKACGNRKFSQCSVSSYSNVIMISAGDYHTLALLSDGRVMATGLSTDGQCNTSEWTDVIMISAGSLHSVAVKSDGTAVAVGSDVLNRCDLSAWKNIAMISAGSTHTVAILTNGNIVSCGGVVGGGSYGDTSYSEKVAFIQAGSTSIVAVTEKGSLIFTGDGLPSIDHVKKLKVDPYCFFTSEN